MMKQQEKKILRIRRILLKKPVKSESHRPLRKRLKPPQRKKSRLLKRSSIPVLVGPMQLGR